MGYRQAKARLSTSKEDVSHFFLKNAWNTEQMHRKEKIIYKNLDGILGLQQTTNSPGIKRKSNFL